MVTWKTVKEKETNILILFFSLSLFSILFSVQKPREQVADAEALLDITNTLVTSVKAHGNEGITPSDFVSCLLQEFGQNPGVSTSAEDAGNSIVWKDIGLVVSHIFKRASGCCTM